MCLWELLRHGQRPSVWSQIFLLTSRWGSSPSQRRSSCWLWREEMWPTQGGRTLVVLQQLIIIHWITLHLIYNIYYTLTKLVMLQLCKKMFLWFSFLETFKIYFWQLKKKRLFHGSSNSKLFSPIFFLCIFHPNSIFSTLKGQ